MENENNIQEAEIVEDQLSEDSSEAPVEYPKIIYVPPVKKVKNNPHHRVGARNAEVAKFYRLAVDGKRGTMAFPTPEAKAFYLDCLKASIKSFPVEVLAYSIINNRAYFVVATYDQTPVSHMRWIAEANSEYAKYFNKYFRGAGYVFKSNVRNKRIKDYMDVAESIMIVHSQPYASGLADGYNYEFSSYKENRKDKLSELNALYWAAGLEEAESMIGIAHDMGPRNLPADFLNLPEVDKFDLTLEKILCDYKVYNKEHIDSETMYRVIAELNERGGYSFDYIVTKLDMQKQHKYELLIQVIVDLAITFGQTYDESIKNLGISFSTNKKARETLLDVVTLISNRTLYAYDYIMNMLGLAYPNYDFLKELILYICDMKGISHVDAIKRLGIQHEPQYVLELVEKE